MESLDLLDQPARVPSQFPTRLETPMLLLRLLLLLDTRLQLGLRDESEILVLEKRTIPHLKSERFCFFRRLLRFVGWNTVNTYHRLSLWNP